MSPNPFAISDPFASRHFGSQRMRRIALYVFAAAALVQFGASASADERSLAQAQQKYEQERARCAQAPATEDRAACYKSAGAALQAAKEGRLDVAPHPFDANKTSRCDPLPPADRQDCIRRMNGEGTTSGSVSQGGIYRELDTTTTQPAPAR